MTTNNYKSRRDFLKGLSTLGALVMVNASAITLTGCSKPKQVNGRFYFPQGVASADPQPDAIMLWTRMVAHEDQEQSYKCTVQLARDPEFNDIIVQ